MGCWRVSSDQSTKSRDSSRVAAPQAATFLTNRLGQPVDRTTGFDRLADF